MDDQPHRSTAGQRVQAPPPRAAGPQPSRVAERTTNVVRCPFRTARYSGREMTVCPGFTAELRWVGLFQSRDQAMVCTHLVGAPHPTRNSRIGACAHAEAPWIVLSARRILDDAEVRAASRARSPLSTLL